MKFKVKINKKAVEQVTQAQIVAARKTAYKMLGEKVDSQEIPFYTGTLQNVKTDVDDSAAKQGIISIRTEGPYADRLYYNPQFNFNKQFNKHAKGEWWEDWLTGKNKKRAHELYKYFYKESSGGLVK